MSSFLIAFRVGVIAVSSWLTACSSLEMRNAAYTPDSPITARTRSAALGSALPVTSESPQCVNGACPIDVLFGTSRKVLVRSDVLEVADAVTTFVDQRRFVSMTNDRGEVLTLGRMTITPPARVRSTANLRCDDLQAAVVVTPESDFTVSSRLQLFAGEEDFGRAAHQLSSSRKDALIFIHGYNVPLVDAAKRVAQLVRDTGFCGVPFLFSWPSAGSKAAYFRDRESAGYSAKYFREFLQLVRTRTGANGVHIIAHSMGNMVLLRALTELREQAGLFAGMGAPIKEVILAAPDVDRDLFRQFVGRIGAIGSGRTMYASSRDKALWLAKKLAAIQRAGLVDESAVIAAGVETIDISKVGGSWKSLNHSSYGELGPVMQDIRALIVEGVVKQVHPPDLRQAFWKPTNRSYWIYSR